MHTVTGKPDIKGIIPAPACGTCDVCKKIADEDNAKFVEPPTSGKPPPELVRDGPQSIVAGFPTVRDAFQVANYERERERKRN
jgi:hypothetical protein